MRTVYLKLEVPDEFNYEDGKFQIIALNPNPDESGYYYSGMCDYTEIQLPTEEEIKAAFPDNSCAAAREGAKWAIEKIKAQ